MKINLSINRDTEKKTLTLINTWQKQWILMLKKYNNIYKYCTHPISLEQTCVKLVLKCLGRKNSVQWDLQFIEIRYNIVQKF